MSTSDQTPGDKQPQRTGHSTILVSQVLNEQTIAWAQGETRPVEEYLKDYPTFGDEPGLLLDLIQNEIDCRRRSGQNPSLQDYLDRFPQIADKIKSQWEAEDWFEDSNRELDAALTTRAANDSLSAEPTEVPETLGAYKILECLGRGGMGTVYKARHEHLGKTVAIKILSQRVTERPDAVARFKREMKAVGALNHPRIVQAFDAGQINGFHYIAMELLPGADLHRVIEQEGPLSVADACSAIRDVASALTAAHAVGLVHRDIKPSNMIRANGQVKLLDLGLARLVEVDSVSPNLTSVCQTFGTPDFMAPEQWDDPHGVDHHADLYALGCSLYFLLTGHPPYDTATYPTASKKMKAHLLEPIPDICSVRADVPRGLAGICQKLMAKLPRDRFSSAEELQHALTQFIPEGTIISFSRMETEIVGGRRSNDRAPSTLSIAAESANPSTRQDQPGIKRSGVLVSLVVLAALAGTGWYVFNSLHDGRNPEPGNGDKVGAKQQPAGSDHLNSQSEAAETIAQNDHPGTEHRLELWKLITPAVVSDGQFQDVKVDGEKISLDASGASQQLWLDFQEFDGDRMQAEFKLQIHNPESKGTFKLVLLPKGQWDNEYYFQVRNSDDDKIVDFSLHGGRDGQQILKFEPWTPTKQVMSIVLKFQADKLTASIDGRLVFEAPRKLLLTGTPALAVQGWRVDIDHPVITVYEEPLAPKDAKATLP